MKKLTILTINPGSTCTKIALFQNNNKTLQETIVHSPEELSNFKSLWDQFEFRLNSVKVFIESNGIFKLSAIVGRGGLLKPLSRGTYLVNEQMIKDAKFGIQGEHVSNLGCALASHIAQQFECPAFVVDPVSVDEFPPIARFSGHPLIERRSLSHALNLRAAAIWASEKLGRKLVQSNYVIGHLGGGISIAAVSKGLILDVNDASSDGPFSPERTGGLPVQQFISLCFSGTYSEKEIQKMVMGKGGLKAYLGTNDLQKVELSIENGDKTASAIYEAMVYQISKEIASMATVLMGNVNAIVLTGGLALSKRFVEAIKKRVEFIAPIVIIPGELEMEAMAAGALRVLNGKEIAKKYL